MIGYIYCNKFSEKINKRNEESRNYYGLFLDIAETSGVL